MIVELPATVYIDSPQADFDHCDCRAGLPRPRARRPLSISSPGNPLRVEDPWIEDHEQFMAYAPRRFFDSGRSSRIPSIVTAVCFDFR